jgi:hypothetical protein
MGGCMTITINGTTGISGVDGSSGTPAYQGNDANTGISFGTDIVTINTGGTARVTTDASGNVGIGTSSPTFKLQIQSGASTILAGADSAATTLTDNTQKVMRFGVPHYTNAEEPVGALFVSNTVSASALLIGGGTAQFNAATSLHFYTAANTTTVTGSERMRIDSSGNVGIGTTAGTTTVSSGLAINNATAANYPGLEIQTAGVTRLYFNANNAESYIVSVSTNPLVILTNGSERMRINSSGNVGIGTSSPSGILDARGDVYLGNSATGTSASVRGAPNWNFAGLNVIRNASNTSTPRSIAMPLDGDNLASTTIGEYNAIWGAYDSSPTTSSTSSALNGAMVYGAYAGHRWVTNGTERMRIDSSGNVGIGLTPTATGGKIQVNSAINTASATFSGNANGMSVLNQTGLTVYANLSGGSTDTTLVAGSTALTYMAFGIHNGTTYNERMRIDSSGRLLVNSTSDVGGNNPAFSVNAENASAFGNIMEARWTGTGSIYHLLVRNGNGLIGGVTSSGSTTAFVTSSDYRLKENVAPMTGALAKIAELKPVTYTWKSNGSAGQGFIAHELQAVVPDAVTGEKDAVDKDGKPQHQGVDTSFLVATLVSAIQELTARLEALENK